MKTLWRHTACCIKISQSESRKIVKNKIFISFIFDQCDRESNVVTSLEKSFVSFWPPLGFLQNSSALSSEFKTCALLGSPRVSYYSSLQIEIARILQTGWRSHRLNNSNMRAPVWCMPCIFYGIRYGGQKMLSNVFFPEFFGYGGAFRGECCLINNPS